MDNEKGDTIWLGWDHSVWIGNLTSISKQVIHGEFRNLGGLEIHITIVFGKNWQVEREDLWEELRLLRSNMKGYTWVSHHG